MTRFDDICGDGLAESLNDLHGEEVTLHFAGGSSRTVTALIERFEQSEDNASPTASVHIRLDSEAGVMLNELDRGTTEIELALEKPGGTTSRRKIDNFVDAFGGMATFDVS